MTPRRLRLPPVVYDDGVILLLTQPGTLAQASADEACELDVQDLRFYEPGALTALLAGIHALLAQGRAVALLNCEVCPAFTYLQRMDFFHHCGVSLPESFRRHDAARRSGCNRK